MTYLECDNFGIGQRVIGAPNDWVEWDETNRFDKPTLLVVGGARTQDVQIANGTAKIFMSNPPEGVQLVSVRYGAWSNENTVKIVAACVANEMMKRGQFDSQMPAPIDFGLKKGERLFDFLISVQPYAERLFQTYIKPMVQDEQGNPLPVEKAVKNMRHLNIATMSFGDFVVENLSDIMKRGLSKIGYSVTQQSDIMKQVCVLNLNGVMPIGKYTGFTTFRIFSMSDFYNSMFQSGTLNRFWADTYLNDTSERVNYLTVSPTEKILAVHEFLKERDLEAEHTAFLRRVDDLTFEGVFACFVMKSFIGQAVQNSINNSTQNHLVPLPYMDKMMYYIEGCKPSDCRFLLTEYEKQAKEDFARYMQRGKRVRSGKLPPYLPRFQQMLLNAAFTRE